MPPNFAEGQKRRSGAEDHDSLASWQFFSTLACSSCHRVFGNITGFTSLYYLYREAAPRNPLSPRPPPPSSGRVSNGGAASKNSPAPAKFPIRFLHRQRNEGRRGRGGGAAGKKSGNKLRFIMHKIKRIKSPVAREKMQSRDVAMEHQSERRRGCLGEFFRIMRVQYCS